ncbi:MAG: hypothetical protein ABS28_07075 [Cryomorphaceae bacterium BACL22 MAG-120619-bin32]|nr:MAG: hypothetical protein ABS28_07075 [Cryomorphaceae bacterium BACL22 MAG-120619-bin32]
MKTLLKNVAFIVTMIITTMVYAQVPATQDTIVIASGDGNAGLLEATINGDKDGSNVRIHPNRVYKLEPGFHFVLSAINVNNDTGTIRIVGETGGKKPVIIPLTTNNKGPGQNKVNGSLELKNLHIQGRDDQGGKWKGHLFEVNGANRSLFVEDCLIEFPERGFYLQSVTSGLTIEMRNNYFRDMFVMQAQYSGNVINAKGVPIESLIFENNTVSNSGMPMLMQNQMVTYALINHNTFINTTTTVFLNPYYYEAYITNNLFYNANTIGTNAEAALAEPDGQAIALVGIDELDINIGSAGIPLYAMDGSQTSVIAPYNDVSQLKIYVADNIYFNEATLDKYNNGFYSAAFPNVAPESYLYSTNPGPHKVDVPVLFMGAREDALFNGNANISRENNIIGQDPGLGTEAISVAEAEQLAIWQRLRLEVPGEVRTPDMTSYYFGDFDPTTIPGIESEDSDGILKFSNLIEDFSINPSFASNIDGHTIGALHWTSEIDSYDPVDGLADIIAAYQSTLSIDEVGPMNVFELKTSPNPFNTNTSIAFNMPSSSHVKISVYNILGAHIATLVDGVTDAGQQSVIWNAKDVKPGLYFCKLESGTLSKTIKMLKTN